MKLFISMTIIGIGLIMLSCASKPVTPPATTVETIEPEPEFFTDAGVELEVLAPSENVREYPNGPIIGKQYQNEKVTVKRRMGNWVQFESDQFEDGYIWAPSIGYKYENLYSPSFYYSDDKSGFRDIEYFQQIFSQRGQKRHQKNGSYELFFKDLGLGSTESTILDVTNVSTQLVEHGITLFVDNSNQQVTKVRVDYLKPVEGLQKALSKSKLPSAEPTRSDNSSLFWMKGQLLKGLSVHLERTAYQAEEFSSIWYSVE